MEIKLTKQYYNITYNNVVNFKGVTVISTYNFVEILQGQFEKDGIVVGQLLDITNYTMFDNQYLNDCKQCIDEIKQELKNLGYVVIK